MKSSALSASLMEFIVVSWPLSRQIVLSSSLFSSSRSSWKRAAEASFKPFSTKQSSDRAYFTQRLFQKMCRPFLGRPKRFIERFPITKKLAKLRKKTSQKSGPRHFWEGFEASVYYLPMLCYELSLVTNCHQLRIVAQHALTSN